MNTLVVYDSQFGNTEQVAQTIAATLRESSHVRLVHAKNVTSADYDGIDLLVLGCPTQAWRPTPAMAALIATLAPQFVHHAAVACFDTRFQQARWLTGSAARRMGQILRKRGVVFVVPCESFYVQAKEGPLFEGELKRAEDWAKTLATLLLQTTTRTREVGRSDS